MSLCIQLPNGKRVSVAAYVKAWRIIRDADPRREFGAWSHFPESAATIRREMLAGLDARINRHIPGFNIGRKWEPGAYWEAWRLSRAVNSPRLIVRRAQVPLEYRARLASRIWSDEAA